MGTAMHTPPHTPSPPPPPHPPVQQALQYGQGKGRRLAAARDSRAANVPASQRKGDAGGLDGRGLGAEGGQRGGHVSRRCHKARQGEVQSNIVIVR